MLIGDIQEFGNLSKMIENFSEMDFVVSIRLTIADCQVLCMTLKI